MSALLLVMMSLGAAPETQAPAATNSTQATAVSSIDDRTKTLSPYAMKKDVREALRRESNTRTRKFQSSDHHQAVKKLASLYRQVERNVHLSESDKKNRQAAIQNRLQRVHRMLKIAQKNQAKKNPKNLKVKNHVLAQAPAGGFFGRQNRKQPGKASAVGQDLVELIENTIQPHTWEVNGGEGRIVYFGNRQVLVVHNIDEVHGQMGNLIQALKK